MHGQMAPGMASWSNSLRSVLRKRRCENPDAKPVATFTKFTVLQTAAGCRPAVSRMLDDVGPNPMPRAPSTNEAAKPPNPTRRRPVKLNCPKNRPD